MSKAALKFVTISLKAESAAQSGKLKGIVGCLLPGGKVLDLAAEMTRTGIIKSAGLDFGTNTHNTHMLHFLRATENRPDIIKALRGKIDAEAYHADDVIGDQLYTLQAPLIPDRNVMCIGKNYSDHIAEINKVNAKKETTAASGQGQVIAPENITSPVIFTKAPQTIIGHGGSIESHSSITKWLDYEVELAVIIGQTCKNVAEQEAMSKVFGYTISNDVTARDIQKRHIQWFKGKSLDTTCPMGPAIVHADDVDPSNLSLKTWINKEERQNSTTANLIFKIPRLISELSKGFTLLPGDVILTGTPDGVGYAMDPPQVLIAGDEIAMEIELLGRLENTVVA
jgi:2-keto-4-pentenoate hydratase/2-oxohepta-3-ene-1,7-dioic acid hydratase in catechol pathway